MSQAVLGYLKKEGYFAFYGCIALTIFSIALIFKGHWSGLLMLPVFGALTIIGIRDVRQNKQSIRRNYPILGHIRFFLEFIRPEIRQYFLENDTEAAPFSRNQRSLVYQRAKNVVDKRAFGTQKDVYVAGHDWINHSAVPVEVPESDFRITIGGMDCKQPYEASIFNISAMSFGALSANAVLALNKGAKKGGFAHDTGEGSISKYHKEHGGDLIWEIGSGYFGCRTPEGEFSPERFKENASSPQVKMIEIKLSQGAKPGHGGVLPSAKVTAEIAEARGVSMGQDCVSPAGHKAFSTPVELCQFIGQLRELSGGKPVGFKFCVGHPWEWFAIAKAMMETGIKPDFIVVDGAEGGTGAAPVEFADHVGAPLQEGLMLVHNTLIGLNIREEIRLGASGKIVSAFDIARTMAIGADWCNSARGFMFSLGCIMAQACHTGHCPTGVTTQDPIRQKALVVQDKAERVYNFHSNTLHALSELVAAAGLSHPIQLTPHHIVRRVSHNEVRLLSTLFKFSQPGDLLEGRYLTPVFERYWDLARADSFSLSIGF